MDACNSFANSFADGMIKYFDRKGDADFVHKLAKWLMDKTGKQWQMERLTDTPHTHTISEQKQEELVADPLVASAMDLFADAEIPFLLHNYAWFFHAVFCIKDGKQCSVIKLNR